MEFNSPRPEHIQLQGQGTIVHPKGTSNIISSLNERILANTSDANGSRNANSIDKNITQDETGSRAVILGNGFTLLAPRPMAGRDAALYEPVDEYLIPSPPLSPKETDTHRNTSHTSAEDGSVVARGNQPLNITGLEIKLKEIDQQQEHPEESSLDGIVVKGVWDNYNKENGTKTYQLHINAFLSQYKVLKPKISSNFGGRSVSPISRYTRRTRTSNKTYASNSDFERVYRTRRTTGGNTTSTRNGGATSDDSSAVPYLPRQRPVTPVSRRKPVSHHHPSPLSHSSITTAAGSSSANHHHHTVNMSWEKLPDYSPSLDTLPPNNNKCLKVDWKGSSMDLSHDPLRNKLHPAELVLAQILRLPCDLYLDSKRRFFIEKVHRLKQGMPFRRTDAQKACRIDVNKASRLFAAYEKIGWLQDSHFKRFL
ncbi:uncharacterized protein KLLA0_F02365g [Kluyveromyces lactis]|uniref:KLLA0F02365p n=1 Tax=Kluyveromyces lactis (strain ATCC 8585 / CBS 2359 / DSM 70799 / NBRC 1267 / NRRL Y-1140 / WM37) TaxID=284590 RepID=Q6CLK2_KLULA|nr:uncharacterized protein KLLA0_F02365g [Kluyveromyces lactis]CAG97894.1 KLLA0F02365p [Kluyveromyces lactis]|eukprot:XP_455187.1 uncharacterized protein KLLA0_F02365g [Kluyveromyces lactis]